MNVVAFDYETFYDTKSKYGIKELGTWRYLHDDRFNPYLISVYDGQHAWAGSPKDFNWDALTGATLGSHNSFFDSMVYRTMVEKGTAPKIEIKDWICTANMSVYLCNRRSLADACEFLLKEKLDKSIRDYANGKTPEDMKAEGKWEDMLAYGRSDAIRCWQLFAKFGHLWPVHERKLSEMTIYQGSRGIQIDLPLLDEYIRTAFEMVKTTESVLPWVKDGAPPSSPKALAEECRRHGIPGPPVKSRDGEEAFQEWEKNYGPKHQWISNVSNWRSVNKFLDTLQTIKLRLMPDSVLSFELKYFGSHTGRWSGGGGLNLLNLRKEPLYRDDNGFLVSDEAKLDAIRADKKLPSFVTAVLDIRKLFIPRQGKKMILSDLSQIEPRVLAWLVGNKEMLDLMAGGMSPYEAHARATMQWTGGILKNEDPKKYNLAKARVLALGYQAGWEKFILMAKTLAGLDITEDDPELVEACTDEGLPMMNQDGTPKMISGYGTFSKATVKDFRETNPGIVSLWKTLDENFKDSVGGNFELTLPSGRKLVYRDVRQEYRRTYDEGTKRWIARRVFTAEIVKNEKVMRFPIYGGLLCENLTQATARDVFAEYLLALQDTPGIDVLWSVHDEIVAEVDPEVTAKDIEQTMSKTPEWLRGCPIAAEAKKVPCYLK